MLTVYKASAGSGKTYTLAFEYIKLVLGHKDHNTGKYVLNTHPRDEHRAILAITFTNKATEEMKRRIIKELAIIAEMPSMGGEKSPYLSDLLSLFECTHQQLKETARTVLCQLLFDYNFFNVSTIDSFFQNVLRTFAFEAELEGNYDVEIDDSYVISMSVSALLNSMNYEQGEHSQRLVKWLTQFMMMKVKEGASFNVFNRRSATFDELLKLMSMLSNEQFKLRMDDVLEYFENPENIVEFEKQLNENIAKTSNLIKKAAKNAIDALTIGDFEGLNSNIRNSLVKWSDDKKVDKIGATLEKVMAGTQSPFTQTYLKKSGNLSSQETAVRQAIIDIVSLLPHQDFLMLLRKNTFGLGLVGDALLFIKKYREDNNLILLSDTNDLLQRIISEQDAPFIYERMGVRLKHFLIDEFQDTSRMQWKNISPLVSESLSQGNDNLIIGDEKQCIYRFRNSDPSLLREQVSKEYNRYVFERGTHINDNTNWRSSAEVVKFNNTLFATLATNLGVEDIYSNVTQQVSKGHVDHHGYVKVEYIEEGKNVDEKVAKSLEKMATDIKRQLDSGYKQKDIAILVDRKKYGIQAIDYLRKLSADPDSGFPQINIISDDTLMIDTSPMVRLILSVMRLVNDEVEDVSKYKSKRNYNKVLHRYIVYVNNGMAPEDALNCAINQESKDVDEMLEHLLDMKCLSLPSLVERIIELYINEESRARDIAFITAFQDEVLDFCAHGSNDINSFLKWWDNPKTSHIVTSPAEIDAIKVMTIHKSKGLEFKCVHIPVACWDMVSNTDVKWFEMPEINGFDTHLLPPVFALQSSTKLKDTPLAAQYLENRNAEIIDVLNVTYVAFTRAVDELCINCFAPRNRSESIAIKMVEAFKTATADYCASMAERHSDAKGEIYIPLDNIDENNVLEIGRPTKAQEKDDCDDEEKKVPPAEQVEERVSTSYYTNSREDLWEKIRIEDDDATVRARERGIFLHNVMENVHHPEDLPQALQRQAYRAHLDEKEVDEAYGILSKALADEQVYHWFNGYTRVLAEQSMLNKGVGAGKVYRPDRVVWTSHGTIDVIDYKFGEERDDQYRNQVKKYMETLAQMGYKNIRGFLWYVEKGKIENV